MKSITDAQQAPKQLDRLAAQRRTYSDAKTLQNVRLVLSVPVVLVWSVAVLAESTWGVYAAFWGVSVVLIDILILLPWQRSIHDSAAKIQELFDCDVLQIPWKKLKAGHEPDPESIAAAALRYRRIEPGFESLRNWYSTEVVKVPLHIGRIICQRSNCFWDGNLRRRYAMGITGVSVGLLLLVMLISIWSEMTVKQLFIAGVAPAAPLIVFAIRQYGENVKAATRSDRLRDHGVDLLKRAIAGGVTEEALAHESRVLQDEIFAHRRISPLVFDWFYNWFKKEDENRMNKGAEALVEEALEKLGRRQTGRGAGY